MPNEALLAAITGALETGSTQETDDELETTDDGFESGTTDDQSDGSGSNAAEDNKDADGDDESGEQEAAGEANAAETDASAGDAGKSGVKPPSEASAEAIKPKDHLNDPVDARLKEATRERITGLIEIAKNVTAERDKVKQDFEGIMGYIHESKASPEQYGQALEYLGLVNSGDPGKLEQAWAFMQNEMIHLGRMLGKDVPGLDYLANHADLKAAVAAGQVTEAVAKETARLRDQQAQTRQLTQHQSTQAQQTQARQQVLTQGRNEMSALGKELAARDGANYARKAAILTKSLKPVFAQLDPRQWKATFQAAYDNLELPAAPAAAAPGKSNVPKNQPLRAKTPAGGASPAPKSMAEAIKASIGM